MWTLNWSCFSCEGDHYWYGFDECCCDWVSIDILLLVCELEVEELSEIGANDFKIQLSECFTEADSSSTGERSPTERVALLTSWSKVEIRVRIESLWQVLLWSLPFIWVEMKSIDVNAKSVILLELHFATREVLQDFVVWSGDGWWTEPEWFRYHTLHVFEVLTVLEWADFFQELLHA